MAKRKKTSFNLLTSREEALKEFGLTEEEYAKEFLDKQLSKLDKINKTKASPNITDITPKQDGKNRSN